MWLYERHRYKRLFYILYSDAELFTCRRIISDPRSPPCIFLKSSRLAAVQKYYHIYKEDGSRNDYRESGGWGGEKKKKNLTTAALSSNTVAP